MAQSNLTELDTHRPAKVVESEDVHANMRILREIVVHLGERVELLETRELLARPKTPPSSS